MRCRSSSLFLVTGALVVGLASWAHAQVYTGTIAGRVTDETGGVLPGATITISSPVLLTPQTAPTGPSGAYRFAELPVGTYSVSVEMSGFQSQTREDIIITGGSTATINFQLKLAKLAETVTVTGESPIVDVRETGLPETFDQARLQDIPSARDPWVIIEQTPGMVMDRENVGGNQSGQQSVFLSRGTGFGQNMWNYDGVNITDYAASGASPMYFDFDSFQEINVTTGGQDVTMQSAGTQINFIVKQGTNAIKGQGAFYGLNDSLQSTNVTPDLAARGAGAGAPIKKILDYSFDVGGPIWKDKMFLWGSYGVQDIHKGTVGFLVPGCTNANDPVCLQDDPTKLRNSNIKYNWDITPNDKFNFLFAYNDKTRATRGASDLRPLETTYKQSGPVYIYKFEDTHIVNPNFLFTGRFAYVDGGFRLDYQSPDLRNTQGAYDLSTGAYSRSLLDFSTVRPQYVANVDANYFKQEMLGGDHEFKFGFQYKKTPIDSFTTYGGDVQAVFDNGVPAEAWFHRPSAISYTGTFASGYIQDTYTRGRMNAKLSVRYDYQDGQNKASSIPANEAFPALMPAIDFAGTPAIKSWSSLSPRFGFTYDLSGDGKTIARASYARYYDLLQLYDVVKLNNAAGVSEVDLPWTDLNGDGLVQPNEVDQSTVLYTNNFDPKNPGSATSPNQINPNLTPPKTDEFLAGFEREIIPNFSASVDYIYKRFTNMIWWDWPYFPGSALDGVYWPFPGVTSADFVPTSATFNGRDFTYYQLAPGLSKTGDFLTNRPDYHQRYQGIELTANKRLSNRWLFNTGFTYAIQREFFDGSQGIFDPTNIDLRQGGEVAPSTTGSGLSGYFLNSRWNYKADALVQLPAGVNLAGKINGREGFPFMQTYRTDPRDGSIGRVEVLYDSVGTTRLPSLWTVDMRAEKVFNVGTTRISGMVDVFNLFNSATILKEERRQNLSTANQIQDLLSPRVFRFGVRVLF